MTILQDIRRNKFLDRYKEGMLEKYIHIMRLSFRKLDGHNRHDKGIAAM